MIINGGTNHPRSVRHHKERETTTVTWPYTIDSDKPISGLNFPSIGHPVILDINMYAVFWPSLLEKRWTYLMTAKVCRKKKHTIMHYLHHAAYNHILSASCCCVEKQVFLNQNLSAGGRDPILSRQGHRLSRGRGLAVCEATKSPSEGPGGWRCELDDWLLVIGHKICWLFIGDWS